MRTRMAARNHPMQPLSPKHQPWFRTQAPDRIPASLSKSAIESKFFGPSARTVEQELLVRARIEQRSQERQEKLHDAVSHDRVMRRRQRHRAAGHEGEIVKQELSKANVQFER